MKLLLVSLLFLVISNCYAQEVAVKADIGVGSGLQTAIGSEDTVWNHTPIFLDFEIMVNTDDDPFFEAGLSLTIPVEDRMGLGIVPKIKLRKNFKENELYFTAGVPIYFIGFDLFGIRGELGYKREYEKDVSFFVEGVMEVFPFGDDVVKPADDADGMMTQFNVVGGVSLEF